MPDDLYSLLGVPRGATAEAIKAAFRDLAKRLHPDRNPGDDETADRFKRLSAAYAILSDPDRRLVYDHLGLDAVRESTAADLAASLRESRAPPPAMSTEQRREAMERMQARASRSAARHVRRDARGPSAFSEAPRSSGFNASTVTMKSAPRRGEDLQAHLVVFLREAALGGLHEIPLPTGTVNLRLPVSAADGDRLVVRGAGQPGHHGGDPGDLWITVRVRPDPVFRREALNLHVDVHLTRDQAASGGRFEVPTLGGTVLVDFPKKSFDGQKVRVLGLGMPGPPGRGSGDLYATVRVSG